MDGFPELRWCSSSGLQFLDSGQTDADGSIFFLLHAVTCCDCGDASCLFSVEWMSVDIVNYAKPFGFLSRDVWWPVEINVKAEARVANW